MPEPDARSRSTPDTQSDRPQADEFPMPVLERLLTACLEAQDVKGVAAVIGAMAVRDPHRAEDLRQAILLGCTIAQERA